MIGAAQQLTNIAGGLLSGICQPFQAQARHTVTAGATNTVTSGAVGEAMVPVRSILQGVYGRIATTFTYGGGGATLDIGNTGGDTDAWGTAIVTTAAILVDPSDWTFTANRIGGFWNLTAGSLVLTPDSGTLATGAIVLTTFGLILPAHVAAPAPVA